MQWGCFRGSRGGKPHALTGYGAFLPRHESSEVVIFGVTSFPNPGPAIYCEMLHKVGFGAFVRFFALLESRWAADHFKIGAIGFALFFLKTRIIRQVIAAIYPFSSS